MMDQELSLLMIEPTRPAGKADGPTALTSLSNALHDPAGPDLRISAVPSLEEATALLRQKPVDAILLGQGDDDGMIRLCSFATDLPILMIAEEASADAARRSIHAGADDVLLPADLTAEGFRRRIELAIARKATEGHRLR